MSIQKGSMVSTTTSPDTTGTEWPLQPPAGVKTYLKFGAKPYIGHITLEFPAGYTTYHVRRDFTNEPAVAGPGGPNLTGSPTGTDPAQAHSLIIGPTSSSPSFTQSTLWQFVYYNDIIALSIDIPQNKCIANPNTLAVGTINRNIASSEEDAFQIDDKLVCDYKICSDMPTLEIPELTTGRRIRICTYTSTGGSYELPADCEVTCIFTRNGQKTTHTYYGAAGNSGNNGKVDTTSGGPIFYIDNASTFSVEKIGPGIDDVNSGEGYLGDGRNSTSCYLYYHLTDYYPSYTRETIPFAKANAGEDYYVLLYGYQKT